MVERSAPLLEQLQFASVAPPTLQRHGGYQHIQLVGAAETVRPYCSSRRLSLPRQNEVIHCERREQREQVHD